MIKRRQIEPRTWAALLAVALSSILLGSQPSSSRGPEKAPGISAERDRDIRPLLGPYAGEREIVDGWRVTSIRILGSYIRIGLEKPDNNEAALVLKHPSQSKSPDHSKSFALEREGPESAQVALDELSQTIRNLDHTDFWAHPPTRVRAPDRFDHVQVGVRAFFHDGVAITALALFFVLLHLRRVLKDAPGWVPWSLAALVLVGALLRLALSPETVMNAWPYSRTPSFVSLILNGPTMAWVTERYRLTLHLTDAIHVVDLLIASLTPLVFFAHARFVLKSWQAALFATVLLVFLPIHLRFSRSDVEYVQSLATSSLTFVALYTALQDPSRVWRWGALLVLPILSLATYAVRPENMVFVVVDIGAILLTAGRHVSTARQARVLTIVVGAASYSFLTNLLVNYGRNVEEGLSLDTLKSASELLFNTNSNTLINPAITPPLIIVLAGAGLFVLLRSGNRRQALYLSGWLAGFFLVHSYVVPSEPAMMARYHMHLITPVLLLAASATPLLLRLPRRVPAALLVTLVLSPLMHRSFITNDDFMVMREYTLMRDNRGLVPDGCTALEFMPLDSLTEPEHAPKGDSRMERQGTVLASGVIEQRWKVISLAEPPSQPDSNPPPQEQLTAEAQTVLDNPPECLVFLEGMTCRTHRPPHLQRAPACSEVLERMHAETLVETTFAARIYDERNAGRIDEPRGVDHGDLVRVAIHRLYPKEPPAPTLNVGTPSGASVQP